MYTTRSAGPRCTLWMRVRAWKKAMVVGCFSVEEGIPPRMRPIPISPSLRPRVRSGSFREAFLTLCWARSSSRSRRGTLWDEVTIVWRPPKLAPRERRPRMRVSPSPSTSRRPKRPSHVGCRPTMGARKRLCERRYAGAVSSCRGVASTTAVPRAAEYNKRLKSRTKRCAVRSGALARRERNNKS